MDAHESVQGGILVVVTGHMTLQGWRDGKQFVHTFFLNLGTGSKKSFYVHNDILRFVEDTTQREKKGGGE